MRVFRGKEVIDGRLSLHPDQRDLLVMSLLYRMRSASANGEVEYGVERLLRIVHHVSEHFTLTVLTDCSQFEHSMIQFD
jgi:hypothetical protein